jgi:nitroreductase
MRDRTGRPSTWTVQVRYASCRLKVQQRPLSLRKCPALVPVKFFKLGQGADQAAGMPPAAERRVTGTEERSMTSVNSRTANHPIDSLFLMRWSPRAFTGEEIPEATLFTLLEAARWAPSSYNSQPWRFLFSKKDSRSWPTFVRLLSESNQSWAKNASALLIVVSKKTFVPPGQDAAVASRTHSFDAGAAWAHLALQASLLGWHAHAMAGFDIDRTRTELSVPDDYRIEAAIAIGRRGDKSTLPERLQTREAPNGRRPLAETVLEGGFPVG